jgi:translation initiation factor 1A
MGKGRKGRDAGDRQLILADGEATVYGQIVAPLGQGQFRVNCSDGIPRTAKIRGRDYKKVWMQPNDVVLLSLREWETSRADIQLKYWPREVKVLRDNGYISDSFVYDENTLKIDFD